METILFLLGIIAPFSSYGLIGYVLGEVPALLKRKQLSKIDGIFSCTPSIMLSWALGLEIHLISAFGMYLLLGIPVFKAYWFSLIVLFSILIIILSRKDCLQESFTNYFTLTDRPKLSLNGILFFTVSLWIGITIFSVGNGIKTFWANNYGDIAIHFGLIMNYIYGAVPLREYHIFPGEYLSYSVLVDFWSALMLSASPTLWNLHIVFVLQWTLIWLICFISLSRGGHKVLPWIVLLGGGSWIQFLANIDLYKYMEGLKGYSHILIDKGFGVTNLLACVWIPQRTSLYGLCTLVVGLSAFGDVFLKKTRDDFRYDLKNKVTFQLGALFSISLLANFHMAFVGGFLVATYIFIEAIYESLDSKKIRIYPIYFIVSLVFFLSFAYFHYSGKESMISFADGWMNTNAEEPFNYMLKFWSLNLTILIFPILYLLAHLQLNLILSFIALFLFGNFISLSSWEWDNYKLFIGLFVSLLMLAGYKTRPSELIEVLLMLSIFPGMFETAKSITFDQESEIYSSADLYKADQIRGNTPKDAIIAGAPNHNSSISIAGRKIYYGYAGWLSSHNIDGRERESINSNIEELKNCKKGDSGHCPNYVLDDQFSKEALKSGGFIPTSLPFLFKVPS